MVTAPALFSKLTAVNSLTPTPRAASTSPAALFLGQVAALRGTPTPTVPEPTASPTAQPAQKTLQIPGATSAEIAEIKSQVAEVLAQLSSETRTPEAAVLDTLRQVFAALSDTDTLTGSNFTALLTDGLATKATLGQDSIPAATPRDAADQVLDLVANVLGITLPAAAIPAPNPDAPMISVAPLVARVLAGPTTKDPIPDGITAETPTARAPTQHAQTPTQQPQPQDGQTFKAHLLRQIAEAGITATKRDGATSLELTPVGLGRLEASVETTPQGLRVTLRADNPLVLEALRADRDGLTAALTGQGGQAGFTFSSFQGHDRPTTPESLATEALGPADDPNPETETAQDGSLMIDILA